jgi:hypothetical protein
MVAVAAEVTATRGENREVIYFIDNSASLFSMVKGSSGQPQVARCSHIVGFHCLKYNVRPWFEFVGSASNWSDGISRELAADPFCAKHGIPTQELVLKLEWWRETLDVVKNRILGGFSLG